MAEMSHLVTKKPMVHGTPRGQSIDSKTSPGTSNHQEYSQTLSADVSSPNWLPCAHRPGWCCASLILKRSKSPVFFVTRCDIYGHHLNDYSELHEALFNVSTALRERRGGNVKEIQREYKGNVKGIIKKM